MMKRILVILMLLLLFPQTAQAAALPEEVLDLADNRTKSIAGELERWDAADFTAGVLEILESLRPELTEQFRMAIKNALLLLLIVLFSALIGGVFAGVGGERFDPAVLVAVVVMAGMVLQDLDGLVRSAAELLAELDVFAANLLPMLAAAVAATGAVGSATIHQVATVWLSSFLIRLVSAVLLPLLTTYIVLAAVSAVLPGNTLGALADGIKKAVSWLLGGFLSLFTAYLSAAHVISGSADALALRVTKATLSSVVPVVGSILSGTAESVLAGAGLFKNAVGIVGLLGVLSMSLLPFLSMLVQYLACRVAALAAAAADGGALSGFLNQISGAFGLLLGMVGSCMLLVLISIFACVAVVTP